jgi:hypothetical protein
MQATLKIPQPVLSPKISAIDPVVENENERS